MPDTLGAQDDFQVAAGKSADPPLGHHDLPRPGGYRGVDGQGFFQSRHDGGVLFKCREGFIRGADLGGAFAEPDYYIDNGDPGGPRCRDGCSQRTDKGFGIGSEPTYHAIHDIHDQQGGIGYFIHILFVRLKIIGAFSFSGRGGLLFRNDHDRIAIPRAAMPSARIVSGVPIHPEILPISGEPRDWVRTRSMAKKLITLPLMAGSALTWMIVLLIVVCDIITNPHKVAKASAKGNQVSCENNISPAPSKIVLISNIFRRLVPRLSEARKMAPPNAPSPIKLSIMPKVEAFPLKM